MGSGRRMLPETIMAGSHASELREQVNWTRFAAILIVALTIGACFGPEAEQRTDHHQSEVSGGVGRNSMELAGVSAQDVESANAFFADFAPDPEGPVLPESARANRLIGDCLASFGVAVTYAGAGGVLRPPNPTQQAREDALLQLCLETMGRLGLVSLSESDPDVVRRRYDGYIGAYYCLTQKGIDVEAPPSFDAFLDGQPWSPFNRVPTIVNTEKGRLEGAAVECAVP